MNRWINALKGLAYLLNGGDGSVPAGMTQSVEADERGTVPRR